MDSKWYDNNLFMRVDILTQREVIARMESVIHDVWGIAH